MAVTVGATGSTASASGVTSITLGSNITLAGTNLYLAVAISNNGDADAFQYVNSCTWDLATPENLASIVNADNADFVAAEIWGLANPTAGTDTVTANWTGTNGNVDGVNIGVIELEGAHQTTSTGNTQEAGSQAATSPSSLTMTGVGSGDLVIDCISSDDAAITVGADQTEHFNITDTSPFPVTLGVSTQGDIATDTMSWTWSGSNDMAHCAIVIKEASATVEQEGFRIRNDDGSETTATWIAAQDTNANVEQGALFRIRFLINATGDPASTQYTVEIKEDSESDWIEVPIE